MFEDRKAIGIPQRVGRALLVAAIAVLWVLGGRFAESRSDGSAEPVSFDREIRPVLAGMCLRCHGGVRELAGLHLGDPARATAPDGKGKIAIVPGEPEASELMRRITAPAGKRMPPDGEPLSPRQVEAFRRWIGLHRGEIAEPRLTEVELDFVVLTGRTDGGEARGVLNLIKGRIKSDHPQYKRFQQLDAAYP